MGYRSCGKLFMAENVYDMVPKNLKEELADIWTKETQSFENDGYVVYSFYDWKWYSGYEEVEAWNRFFNMLEETVSEVDWDFIVVGEDNAVIDHRTQEHLAVSRNIEVFN